MLSQLLGVQLPLLQNDPTDVSPDDVFRLAAIASPAGAQLMGAAAPCRLGKRMEKVEITRSKWGEKPKARIAEKPSSCILPRSVGIQDELPVIY